MGMTIERENSRTSSPTSESAEKMKCLNFITVNYPFQPGIITIPYFITSCISAVDKNTVITEVYPFPPLYVFGLFNFS